MWLYHIEYLSHLKSLLAQTKLVMVAILTTETQLDAKKFEMVPQSDAPLSMNDYLVHKKPPWRVLTFSESEKNKQCM